MTEEQKKKYLEAYNNLEPLIDEIIESCSGQSWWSPPGESFYYSCDMGYVCEFLEQLEEWLNSEKESRYNTRKPNSNLINPPEN